MSNRWDRYFIDVALRTAALSYATRLQVGAVAVRSRRIICVGFNGTLPAEPNVCEDSNGVTLPNVIHAEDNLVRFARELKIDIEGCSLYVTHSPCLKCADIIVNAKFSEVVYLNDYRSHAGVEKLISKNIPTRKFDMTEKYTIWSKPNCTQCDKAKLLLSNKGILFEEKKIGINADVQDLLSIVPTAKSVPQIFAGDNYIGGYQELLAKVG